MTAPMLDTFSLGDTVRAVLAEQIGETSLGKLCAEVSAAIAPEHREDALRQALPQFVAMLLRDSRKGTAIRPSNVTPEQAIDEPESNPQPLAPVRQLPARSAKVAGIREHWRRALGEWYSIDGKGGRAMLASLNREQLAFNINGREVQAQRCMAHAVQLRGLLDLMVHHDVQHVGELPETVLAQILTPAA